MLESLKVHHLILATEFELLVQARWDAHQCSFNTEEGFWERLHGSKEQYLAQVADHLHQNSRKYTIFTHQEQYVGILEYAYSNILLKETGYLNLFYVFPPYRGTNASTYMHDYLEQEMKAQHLLGMFLSVSFTNTRALRFYKKMHWQDVEIKGKTEHTKFLFKPLT